LPRRGLRARSPPINSWISASASSRNSPPTEQSGNRNEVVAPETVLPASKELIAFALEKLIAVSNSAAQQDFLVTGIVHLASFRSADEVAALPKGFRFAAKMARDAAGGTTLPSPSVLLDPDPDASREFAVILERTSAEGEQRVDRLRSAYPFPRTISDEAMSINMASHEHLMDGFSGLYQSADGGPLRVRKAPSANVVVEIQIGAGDWMSTGLDLLRKAKRISDARERPAS